MAPRKPRSVSLDTTDEARKRQVEAWIAMGPEGRVRLAASMSDEVRRLAKERQEARTPQVNPSNPGPERSGR